MGSGLPRSGAPSDLRSQLPKQGVKCQALAVDKGVDCS